MDDTKFVISDKGLLKEYHGDEEVLQIPDGVKKLEIIFLDIMVEKVLKR